MSGQVMKTSPGGMRYLWIPAALFFAALTFAHLNTASGQQTLPFFEEHETGQNIAPAFEGWEANADGTFNMVFGYFNRNFKEQPDIPVGPNNNLEPGGPDQGQPTHFFPRRNKFIFRIRVPKDFGTKELVWTLTVNGKTETAYATLKPDYILEKDMLQVNGAMGLGLEDDAADKNMPPVVQIEGEGHRTVKVGEPLALSALVTDDGIWKARAAPKGFNGSEVTALGLRVAWFVYRGPADQVTFDPEQFKVYQVKKAGGNSPWSPAWFPPPTPPDGKYSVKAAFDAPGTYVIRLMAHDGGLDTTKDVTVTVLPASSASAR